MRANRAAIVPLRIRCTLLRLRLFCFGLEVVNDVGERSRAGAVTPKPIFGEGDPFRGNGREFVMRRVLKFVLATAAVGLATPALAVPTLVQQNGPDLSTTIHASITNQANDTAIVYGCTQNNGQCANTTFEGLQNGQINTAAIHITEGAGFASIKDADYDSKVPST